MKNLKKVLALVLVVAMMASFATVSAAFPDADSINDDFTVAVDVLTGMGVIGGYADGTFRPTNLVNRGTFAKMVSYVMNEGKNAAASYGASATLAFSDVDAASVLTPSIGYVVTKGYVDGYPDGTYRPSNPVSGLAAAKILLNALGIEGEYTGTGWQNRVLGAGEDAKLFKGMDNVDLTKSLTREAAAQMVWNAMNYSATGATVKYTVLDGTTVVSTWDSFFEAYVIADRTEGYTVGTTTVTTDSIGAVKFGLKTVSIPDAFGRKSTAYTNGKDGLAQVIYASYAPTPVLEYTTATTNGKIAAALGCTLTSDTIKLTVIEDGDTAGADVYAAATKLDDDVVGAQGALTQVYKVADKQYEAVVVYTYAVKLTEGMIVKAAAATPTRDAVEAHLWFDFNENEEEDAGETFKTAAFKKDDLVLYTVGGDKLQSVVKANFVMGKVTAEAAEVDSVVPYIRVNGDLYYKSATNDGIFGDGYYELNDEGVYFLDSYNNIIAYGTTPPSAPIADQYVYVIEVKEAAANAVGGSDLFGTGATVNAAKAQAKVIDLTTGVIKIVDLAIGKDIDNADVFLGRDGEPTEVAVDGDVEHADEMVYKYTLINGAYALEGVEGETGVAVETDEKSASIVVDDEYKVATSATKITVVEYTQNLAGAYVSATVSTTTGYANFKDASYTGFATVDSTTNVVSDVLVVKAATPVPTSANYAVFKGEGETDAKGTKLAFYFNGAVVEYYAGEVEEDVDFAPTTPGTVYDLTIAAGKVIGEEVDETAGEGTITVIDGNMVAVDSSVYYLNADCVIVDKDAQYALDTLAVGDAVTFYGDDANHVAFIVIDNA